MSEYIREKVGEREILKSMCLDCDSNAMLSNPQCRECIIRNLYKEKVDRVYLQKKDFEMIIPEDGTAKLREIANIVGGLGKKIDTEYIKSCGDSICSKKLETQMRKVLETLRSDPVRAYYFILNSLRYPFKERPQCKVCMKKTTEILRSLEKALSNTQLVAIAKSEKKIDQFPYSEVMPVFTKPSFIGSYIETIPPTGLILDSYPVGSAKVTIFELKKRAENCYFINPIELNLSVKENEIIKDIFDVLTSKRMFDVEDIEPREMRENFIRTAEKELKQRGISGSKLKELSEIIVRYSAGYDLLEIMFNDEKVQDIYADSPGDSPVYIYHEDFDECITNVILGPRNLESLSAKFRSISARPFDESAPVLHLELEDLGIRVCGLCSPATFRGTGFAFRRHRSKPWSLVKLCSMGALDAYTAGLLSFLVDGQCSILITGPRGSGKTSFLSALIAEITTNYRMIVIEDTPEVPTEQMKKHGFKIQHMRTKAALGGEGESGYELSAENALRTALRLGESVLILGEVRGHEAKALFEAMRIGASGNVVMGTIHGSGPYDTWDRIVNDLDVPSTSFKATDIVVSLATLRVGEGIKRVRKLTEITEVGKEWTTDPLEEHGFHDIVAYDRKKDKFIPNLSKSDVVKLIANLKGISVSEALKNIELRAKIKKLYIDFAGKYKTPEILEIDHVIKGNNIYANHAGEKDVYQKIRNWLEGECKRIVDEKRFG